MIVNPTRRIMPVSIMALTYAQKLLRMKSASGNLISQFKSQFGLSENRRGEFCVTEFSVPDIEYLIEANDKRPILKALNAVYQNCVGWFHIECRCRLSPVKTTYYAIVFTPNNRASEPSHNDVVIPNDVIYVQ